MNARDAAMHLLLVGLATGLFLLQLLADLGWAPDWLPALVTLGTLAAGLLALTRPTLLRWPLVLSSVALAAGLLLGSRGTSGVAAVIGLLLLSFALLRQVLAAGAVTRQRIEGAVALYLLVALLFATAYETLEAALPGAFAGATAGPDAFRYFSLVVQTTVGFGDITPAVPVARTLVTLQAVLGQLFIAILLARLVSLELAERKG